MKTMTQVHDWLFPVQPKEELDVEPISNRRFVVMVTLGIVVITLTRLLLT